MFRYQLWLYNTALQSSSRWEKIEKWEVMSMYGLTTTDHYVLVGLLIECSPSPLHLHEVTVCVQLLGFV